MQLSSYRFHVIISLLITVIRIEAEVKRSRNVTVNSSVAMCLDPAISSGLKNGDTFEDGYQDSSLLVDDSQTRLARTKRLPSSSSSSGKRHGRTIFVKAIVSNPKLSPTQVLAHKLAKDALQSSKMQDTFKRLTDVRTKDGGRQQVYVSSTADSYSSSPKTSKEICKSCSRPRKKKRKRHKDHPARDRIQHAHVIKRKPTSKLRRGHINLVEGARRKLSLSDPNGINGNKEDNLSEGNSEKKEIRRAIDLASEDYMDYSVQELPTFNPHLMKVARLKSKKKAKKKVSHISERESMIAKLMKTTTRDPRKKSPGDQGVEYSEYYSEGDILNDPPVNKIESKDDDTSKNSRSRLTRQVLNGSSIYSQESPSNSYIHYLYSIPKDRYKNIKDRRSEDGVYKTVNSLQNYVPISQSNSLGQSIEIQNDNDFNYGPKYESLLEKNGNPVYPFSSGSQDTMADTSGLQIEQEPSLGYGNDQPQINFNNNKMFDTGKTFSVSNKEYQYPVPSLLTQAQSRKFNSNQDRYGKVNPLQLSAEHESSERFSSRVGNDLNFILTTQRSLNNILDNNFLSSSTQNNKMLSPSAFTDNIQPLSKLFASLGVNASSSWNHSPGSSSSSTVQSSEATSQTIPSLSNLTSTNSHQVESTSTLMNITEVDKSSFNSGSYELLEKNSKDNWTANRDLNNFDTVGPETNLQMAKPSTNDKTEGQDRQENPKNNCTTTTVPELNPKLKGVGEASSVPPEPEEVRRKEKGKQKEIKVMEHHLLPMTTTPAGAIDTAGSTNTSNITAMVNETKEVASQILNKIIDELEELKIDRSKTEQKEGLPCKLTGSWVTIQAGVRIDMRVTNHTISVSLGILTPQPSYEGLLNTTWNVTGHAPFKRGGPFVLIATDNHTKTLAVFIGACRVCQGIDTIEGMWTVSREPRDCRDFQMATSIFHEILRRTRLYSAIREKHQEKCTTPFTRDNHTVSING
ncbi:uncharacterized protein LOC107266474 isoform X2 [Cephus cinctus]|uniref:Uncharacterized protein LOC107266474 isoform X2 n=1 Tax=Cephus cinctus TaxID=211228 RepID=A0AAJ7RFD1_CEPCN|nr:uncharacterized protein LOC107266474 isoform X2 [Cephus cinctus]